MKDKALDFMKSCTHCVLSSVDSSGKPQSALVGFSEDDELKLVIGTPKDTRKFRNITANPNVSVVIADEAQMLEIQYEGNARFKTASELGERIEQHFAKIPAAKKRLNDPKQAWLLITPTWIRYVDANTSPLTLEEMELKS